MSTQWLTDHVRGYAALGEEERQAIANFTLLWSLFEARILNNHATSKKILAATRSWADVGQVDERTFVVALNCFRERYYRNGVFTEHFEHLNLRSNDYPDLVRAVLEGEGGVADQAACVFIIVFRFRNNLFHGLKWHYRFAGQLGNFGHANSALMIALERFGRLEED